jgi:response regulator RpfG family c-di-GMP phosphodiesterase
VESIQAHRPEYSVLCVDDDLEFLASLKRLLVPAAGHSLSQFSLDFLFTSNPKEALALARELERPLAVVVCDQIMPQMNGLDFLSQLKDIHSFTQRVLLTGYAGIESAIRAVNERLLDKYLTKPLENPSEFTDVIRRLVREFHLQSQATLNRRRTMAQFEFIQTVTSAETLEAALDTTTNFLLGELNVPWVALFLSEKDQCLLRSTAGHPPKSAVAIYRALQEHVHDCEFCRRIFPGVLPECHPIDGFESGGQAPICVATVAALTVRQQVLGAIIVGSDKADQLLTPENRMLTTSVADIAAMTIIRFRDHETLENTYVGAMASLMDTVEAKDPYTRGHTDRVLSLAMAMAKAAGLSEEAMKDIRYAAALHDLGKLAVPEGILRKPGPLSPKEQAIVMEHPARADAILKHLRFLDAARLIIRSHHERLDGKGYPDQLAGEEIPLGARILAIVDAYDAMTSSRPYRRDMTPTQALAQIRGGAGTQFDSALAVLFVEMMQTSDRIQQAGSVEPVEVQQL